MGKTANIRNLWIHHVGFSGLLGGMAFIATSGIE